MGKRTKYATWKHMRIFSRFISRMPLVAYQATNSWFFTNNS